MAATTRSYTTRSYNENWKKLFVMEQTTAVSKIVSGNFYKVIVYTYSDGKTRSLTGMKTSYIFSIGTFKSGKDNWLAALKLTNIDPMWLMQDIKAALRHNPTTSAEINEAYEGMEGNENNEFSNLLKKFPKDGKTLFSIIKTKRRIYEGNYREYKVSSIKSASYLDIDPEFLKKKLTKDSGKSKNVKSAKDMTNVRDADVKKESVTPKKIK